MRPCLAAFALFGVATLATGGTHESSIEVTFPDEVAGLTFLRRIEYPQKELGINLDYVRSGAVIGSIFIYNDGLTSIPSGIDAPVVRLHFAQVISQVKQLESLGKARAVDLSTAGEQTSNYDGCGPQFLWRGYEMDFPEGMLTSYTYLTAMKNNFVKLRISHRKGDAQGPRESEQFVQEIRKVLGRCQ